MLHQLIREECDRLAARKTSNENRESNKAAAKAAAKTYCDWIRGYQRAREWELTKQERNTNGNNE